MKQTNAKKIKLCKERRENAMKRIISLVVGVFLTVLLIAPVNAVAGSGPGSQGGKQDQVKQTSKTAKDWNEKEKKRSAYKKKALETRKEQMSKTSGSQSQATVK
jgi:hypothetical protein